MTERVSLRIGSFMRRNRDNNVCKGVTGWFLFIVLPLLLMLIQFVAPEGRIYDEAHYFLNTRRLLTEGITLEFFSTMIGPTGPLHNITQSLTVFLLGTEPEMLRWHNLFFILFSLVIAGLHCGAKSNEIALTVALGFAIPGTWVMSMMALTEAPSVFFLTLSIVLFSYAVSSDRNARFVLFTTAGLMLAISATGRQTMIVLAVAPLLVCILRPRAVPLLGVLIYLITAASLPSVLMYLWQGIQPPDYHVEHYQSYGVYSIKHFFLALGYSAACLFLIAPSFFQITERYKLLAVCSLLAVAIAKLLEVSIAPMMTLAGEFLTNAFLLDLYSFFATTVLIAFGIFLVCRAFQHIIGEARSIELVLWFMLGLTILTTGAIVHQFSSRYIAQALPAFVILGLKLRSRGKLIDQVIPSLGMVIGCLSILSYYTIES